MEDNKGKCFSCKYFDRYFVKGTRGFNPTVLGYCFKIVNTVNSNDSCEHYIRRKPYKGIRIFTKYKLNDFLTELTAIRSMIEDDLNETENENM